MKIATAYLEEAERSLADRDAHKTSSLRQIDTARSPCW
jgi:hypothetical protein